MRFVPVKSVEQQDIQVTRMNAVLNRYRASCTACTRGRTVVGSPCQ
jgi:hypothetical protein